MQKLHRNRENPPPRMGLRLMLVALVLVAVLIILLRLAEFSNHRVGHRRPQVAPAAAAGNHSCRVGH